MLMMAWLSSTLTSPKQPVSRILKTEGSTSTSSCNELSWSLYTWDVSNGLLSLPLEMEDRKSPLSSSSTSSSTGDNCWSLETPLSEQLLAGAGTSVSTVHTADKSSPSSNISNGWFSNFRIESKNSSAFVGQLSAYRNRRDESLF